MKIKRLTDMDWREAYNPLRGLNMAKAVRMLESMTTGDMTDVQWAFEHIEQTDPTLTALVERRISAVEEMDWNILIASQERAGKRWDEALATDQQAALAEAYEQIDNMTEAIAHAALATFRKYAHLQIHTHEGGLPAHLEPLDQWNFVRRGLRGPWYWNPEARSIDWRQLGDPLNIERERLIVRDVRRYVDRIGLIKFVRANLAEKDWDGFVEVYGFNQAIVILPPDVPTDKLDEYLALAAAVSDGGEGALPNGSEVKFPNDARGQQPFRPRLDWLQEQLVLAGTGGLLTMLAEPGSGTLAGGAHADTFETLARAEARRISEMFQQEIDRRILQQLFPDRPHLAYFMIAANEEQDVGEVVDHAVKIRGAFAAHQMDPEQFAEKTGYRLIDAPPAPLQSSSYGFAGRLQARETTSAAHNVKALAARNTEALVENGLQAALEADRIDNRPLAERLYAILEMAGDDDDLLAGALAQLKRDLPALAGEMVAQPILAGLIEDMLATGLVNGIAEGVAERGDAQ